MWPFKKREPKIVRHDLRNVCVIPAYKNFMQAVRCENCDKQFIMDTFGGWSVEWTFKTDERQWNVDPEDLANAVSFYHSKKVNEWTQLGYTDICEGRKEKST